MRGRIAARAARALRRGLAQDGSGTGSVRGLHVTAAAQAPAENEMEVEVNGQNVNVAKGSTVMQACDAAGVDIPRCAELLGHAAAQTAVQRSAGSAH